MKIVLCIVLMLFIVSILDATDKLNVSVFYKERKPSQQVLVKVDSLLNNYLTLYHIKHYNIEEGNNTVIIKTLGLPETHFPFAVAIDGKFTAVIDERTVSFVHFPLFMKGIGRHEGNWSLDDCRKFLKTLNCLLTKIFFRS